MTVPLLQKLESLLQSLPDFYPETALVILFLVLIVSDLLFHKQSAKPTAWLALLGLGGVVWLSAGQLRHLPDGPLFLGLLRNTGLAVVFKCLFGVSGILAILFSRIERHAYARHGEFYSILIAAILGLHLMVMASHLLVLYLAIELVSISSYVLTYFLDNRKSAGGSLRYLLLGGLSSGVMLYGMSWLYGLAGSLHYTEPAFWTALAAQPAAVTGAVVALTLGGLLFKISAVPFHAWVPDVYEAAPVSVAAFFSVAPKVAGVVALLVLAGGAAVWPGLRHLLAVVALASITVGNFSALWQQNARRLLAYSSVAHAGFLLVGVVAGGAFGTQSLVFYAVVYLFMNAAAFLAVLLLERITGSGRMADYRGLGARYPWLGIAFVVAALALAGLPPTAGFTAKLLIFSALWETYRQSGDPLLLALFGWGLLNVAVAMVYYLKIPYLLFFKEAGATGTEAKATATAITPGEKLLLAGVLLSVGILFFKSDWLAEFLAVLLR